MTPLSRQTLQANSANVPVDLVAAMATASEGEDAMAVEESPVEDPPPGGEPPEEDPPDDEPAIEEPDERPPMKSL